MTTDPSLPDLYRAFMSACASSDTVQARWDSQQAESEQAFVDGHLRPGRVLVAGCGHGRGIGSLLEQGCTVVALDRDPDMCRSTSERFESAGVEVVQAEIRQAPRLLGPSVFDSVLCLGLVSGGLFLPGEDTRAAFQGLAGVLDPGGALLIDFLDPGRDHPEGRIQRFDYPLHTGSHAPGCCFWPRPTQVRQALSRVGLDCRLIRLRHFPAEPLVGVVARPVAG